MYIGYNALSTANVCGIADFRNKELNNTALKKNFHGLTNYVNEFTSYLLKYKVFMEGAKTKNVFIKILLLSESVN